MEFDRAMRPVKTRDAVDLASLTTLEVGGPARHYLEVDDEGALLEALGWSRTEGLPVTVLGGGSNVVIADAGVEGLVLRVGLGGIRVQRDGDAALLTAAAGEPWDGVVAHSLADGLAGLECLSGIPGSAGATPIQNVGAYGQEIADVIDSVRVVDRSTLEVSILSPGDLGFDYRTSRLRETPDRFVVLDVSFRLTRGGDAVVRYPELRRALEVHAAAPSPAQVREAVLELRRSKSMVIEPDDPNRRSVGSFFVNPVIEPWAGAELERRVEGLGEGRAVPMYATEPGRVKVSAAWLIEHSGFARGHGRGAVGLSTRHCLALVNRGGATAREIIAFARDIRRAVRDRFGILLQPEPVFLGFDRSNPLDE